MSDSIVCMEDTVYEGDEALTLEFTCVECVADVLTPIDLTGATVIIKYINPTTTGQFAATLYDAANGIVRYAFTDGNGITPRGDWILWPVVTFVDSRHVTGVPTQLTVKKEGT